MQGVKMHLKSLRYDRQHVFMLIVIAECLQVDIDARVDGAGREARAGPGAAAFRLLRDGSWREKTNFYWLFQFAPDRTEATPR